MLRVKNLKLPNDKIVNFSLHKGEGIVICGPNGSGKSLLLKSLVRLVPASFDSFEYLGKDIRNYNINQFRSEVIYIPTSTYTFQDMSVENFFASVKKFSVYNELNSDFDYLKYLEKWGINNSDVSRLSSGQKQMISILRALSLNPKVLLLDEPMANLDVSKIHEVESLIKDWIQSKQGSIGIVSHDVNLASRLNFRTYLFEN